ncbi:CBASS cGAMP-activated phospholipase [Neisseria subflava]|jgi:phospholipase, patatin family|uniref:CBASS cGAMP-activated phospholipase n=1 Tax=Neisseria subflava TaxID=28449 RepID=UPI000D500781|nr:CBASS cGAMP-activated phospholipase [Neisseria subflava]
MNINKPFKILSLTGGGYRGLYTATVLEDIESHLKKKNKDDFIANYFDLITGTSIGGIIALALAYEIPAKEIVNIFDKNGKQIFKKNHFTFLGIYKAKYKSDRLKTILTEWFGDAKLGDLKHPVVIPSVDYTVGKPVTFKTAHNCNFIRDQELRIVDVALATSAAPTFFKRHTINKSEYVDGGLFANSPSLIGLHEAENFFEQDTKNVKILSIGTMSSKKTINPNTNKKGGLVDWGEGNFIKAAENIIELTLSSQQLFMQQIVKHRIKENLVEIDETLTESSAKYVGLDNVTDSAKQILISNANQSSKVALGKEEIQAFFIEHVEAPHFFNG